MILWSISANAPSSFEWCQPFVREKDDPENLEKMNRQPSFPTHSEIRQELIECFVALDWAGNGTIDVRDVGLALRTVGIEPKRDELRLLADGFDRGDHTASLHVPELRSLRTESTSDQRRINFQRFIAFVDCKLLQYERASLLGSHFDALKSESDVITFDALKQACQTSGLRVADFEIARMIQAADRDGDGVVDQAEFNSILFS
jgi:Ca2+-binding EF-hand superfamily protein